MNKKAGSSVISVQADGERWCFDICEVKGFKNEWYGQKLNFTLFPLAQM